MRTVIEACLVGTILIVGIGAQMPVLKQGVAVKMPVASHAVKMRGADEPSAVVVAITADGRVFVGIKPTELAALIEQGYRLCEGRRSSAVSNGAFGFGRLTWRKRCRPKKL